MSDDKPRTTVDHGPESDWRDLICPNCNDVYFDFEITRAQRRHDKSGCEGTLRELDESE